MLNLLKYCLFKDAYKLRTLFSLSKNKSKRCNRAPKYLENLTDPVKRFIQLHAPVLDSSRVDEGTRIIERLISNNAFHHKVCYNNFNDCHYERLVIKV